MLNPCRFTGSGDSPAAATSASRDNGSPLMICTRRYAMLSLIILLRAIIELNETWSWCSLLSRSRFSLWSWLTFSCSSPR